MLDASASRWRLMARFGRGGHVLGTGSGPDAVPVLVEHYVAGSVEAVFDAPVPTDPACHPAGLGLDHRLGTDGEDDIEPVANTTGVSGVEQQWEELDEVGGSQQRRFDVSGHDRGRCHWTWSFSVWFGV